VSTGIGRLALLRDRWERAAARRNPISRRRLRRELRADRELCRSVDWPRCILIVGLPKSGTTWLERLVSRVPGYGARPYADPDGCTLAHDICDDVFTSLPADLLCVLKVHTRPTAANLVVIRRHVDRATVLHRDLRDVAVSRYFHVMGDVTHRHHELYRSLSKEDGLSHSIEVILEDYVPWVRDWRALIARNPDQFREVYYRDLCADPASQLLATMHHAGAPLDAEVTRRAADDVAAATLFAGEDDNLMRRNILRGTMARKGVVGDWRHHFTQAQALRFAAGDEGVLIEAGYEQEASWVEAVPLPA
jgi:Sulfotransferase domain